MKQTIIRADSEEPFFRELNEYKQLLYFFTWRDFKVRYKQTFVGVLWMVLQPLLFAGIISLVLTRRSELSFGFDGASDIVVIFLGFSLWQFFEASVTGAVSGIDSNRSLATKIYVPSAIFVLGPIAARLVDLVLKLGVFLALVLVTGSEIHLLGFAMVIFVTLILGLISAGLGFMFGPINVRWRDITLTLPFITRLMFFTTPIWYPFSLIPENWQPIFLLNPIVAGMELARNAMFEPSAVDYSLLLTSGIEVVVLLLVGIPIFKKTKTIMADYY